MLCKFGITRKIRWFLVAAGIISIVFSVYVYCSLPPEEHDLSMLMGMFSGAGAALLAIGLVNVARNRTLSPEQKKQEEIELKDERNVMINGKSFMVSGVCTGAFLVAASFMLVGLGYRIAAFLTIGGVYMQLISLMLAGRYYQKRT